jgi:drug/metabolite transporter (DMT)-like permease
VTSTLANRFMGEKVTRLQWVGLALRLLGVLLVQHDRNIVLAGSVLGWVASFLLLIGITLGTLCQKRHCGDIDWRTGNLIQYAGAGVLFTLGAFAFETREIHWTGELILATAWLVLSIAGRWIDVLAHSTLPGHWVCKPVLPGAGVTAFFAFKIIFLRNISRRFDRSGKVTASRRW